MQRPHGFVGIARPQADCAEIVEGRGVVRGELEELFQCVLCLVPFATLEERVLDRVAAIQIVRQARDRNLHKGVPAFGRREAKPRIAVSRRLAILGARQASFLRRAFMYFRRTVTGSAAICRM